MKKFRFLPLSIRALSFCLLAAAPLAEAATYYISPAGNDTANNGTNPATPWKTLAKVNATTFAAGDQILFQSGQTFAAPAASDALIVKGSGTSDANRIVYGTYGGSAPAIISQPTAGRNGIKFASTNDWVTIQDLEIVGPHAWSPATAGAVTPYGIHLQGSSGNALQGTTIQRVVIHNFKGSGIRSNNGEKLANTRIEYTEVYQVGDAGIRLGSDTDAQDGEYRTDIYVGHCYVHHTSGFPAGSGNHNGDGIQIACGRNVTVEYCVVHETASAFTGNAGGPVGIWFADVHNGLIQFCESYSNTNGLSSSDGGGIDIDGGCEDVIAQYNYTHDNEGAGYLLAHWGAACSPTSRNTFRYNISINDSKSSVQGGLAVWCAGGPGSGLDTRFYNNLVVQTRASRSDPCLAILTSNVANSTNPVQVYNNIFITSNGHKLTNTVTQANAIIKNNIWWALDGNFNYNTGTLATSDVAGIQANPLIANTGALMTPPTVGFASIDQMPRILAQHFKLLDGSPAINAGRDKDLLENTIAVGSRDFFGATIPQGAYDVGANEKGPAGAGRIGFSSGIASGPEGTSLVVTLSRTGGAAGAAGAAVTSLDGLAKAGSDFTAVNTTVSWADGDSADKTLSIPLTDDAVVEGSEVFALLLSNITGSEMAGTGALFATIADNDASPAANYTNNLSIFGSDPFITPGGDGKFYMFLTDGDGTTTAPSRMESTDLVNWSNKQTAYSDLTAQAPHVIFNPLGSEWWYFGTNEAARGPSATGSFSKVNDNASQAPWHFIDPANGQAYLFTGGNNQARHRIDLLSSPNYITQTIYPYLIDGWWGANWEGTTIVKNGSTYYWFMSMNNSGRSAYRLAYATAPGPEGPWTMQTQEDSAAFLRQSDFEGIFGTGAPTLFTDALGTSWLYYQQKQATSTSIVLDRYIAMDPIWFDSTGVPHIRPTRGASRPGPNSLPSAIWPAVAATSTIQAESYAGSSIGAIADGGSGRTVVGTLRSQAYLAFRNVDFGAGLAAVEVNLSSGLADAGIVGSIEVHTGGVNGPLVGVVPVSKTGSWTTFQSFSAGLTQTVTGVKDVFLVFHGIRPGTELMRLDWLKFSASGTVNANNPPVANPDSVTCPRGGSVTFNVLGNDSDPDAGSTLSLVAASNATVANRSFKGSTNNVQIHANGDVDYTPPAGFWGDDVFFYTVKDQLGGLKTGTAKVRVYAGTAPQADTAGLVIVEAEDYADSAAGTDANGPWVVATTQSGYAGSGYVTTADNGTSISANQAYLDYAVDVRTAGVYTVWVRCDQPDANGNISTLGFTTAPTLSNPDRIAATVDNGPDSGNWYWRKQADKVSLRPGMLRMRLSRQDDGHMIDRFVLTTDANYDPSTVNGGTGPLVNAGTLALSSATASVAESAGSVSFTVSRTGGSAGPASIAYATANGTATAGSDYTATSGTLNWADGETSAKTITIPVLDDTTSESSETLTLTLSGVAGAALGSPAAATITVTDDDDSSFAGWSSTINWNGGDSSAGGDPDGDGVGNLLEYALGGNPVLGGASILPLVEALPDSTRLKISFNRDSSLTSLTYEVQAANEVGGAWTTIASSTGGAPFANVSEGSFAVVETGSGNVKAVTVTDGTLLSAGPRRFLRLKVTEAP